MNEIKLIANGKVNLSIDVIRKLDIGYHELDMIIQEIDLSDSVYVKRRQDNKIIVSSNWDLPSDSQNLAYKAANYMMQKYGIGSGYDIYLDKKIPVESGLAGGSADGAALIKAMLILENVNELPISNEHLKFDLDHSKLGIVKDEASIPTIRSLDLYDICNCKLKDELLHDFSLEIAKNIGCDVSFFMRGRSVRVKGIGDILCPIENNLKYYFIIIKPQLNILTKWAYQNLKLNEITNRPNNELIEKALKLGDLELMIANMQNVLEPVVIGQHPIIEQIKYDLNMADAKISMMSGSGSSVFGIFEDYERALKSFGILSKKYDDIFICKGF